MISISSPSSASDIVKEINDVKAQLLAVERELKDLLSAALPEDRKQRERERLLKEKEQLREKENQLREKENLLLKLQLQQPGYAGAPDAALRPTCQSGPLGG